MSSSIDYTLYPDLSPTLVTSIQDNVSTVLSSIAQSSNSDAVLTPVSKTKPWSYLLPVLHHPSTPLSTFAENYAQECTEKMNLVGAADGLPAHTKFVFVGALQSNKINGLVAAGAGGKLVRVETVAASKAIQKFQAAVAAKWDGDNSSDKLEIMLQVDTSREEAKSGVDYQDVDLVKALIKETMECDRLTYVGLMTIGATGDMTAFDKLVELKKQVDCYVCEELNVEGFSSKLSMGMSGDYLKAIERGSTNVRCGSNIFGARDYSAQK